MKQVYVIDCETNALKGYTKLHNVVFRSTESNEVTVFRNVHEEETALQVRQWVTDNVSGLVGHNILGFDLGVMVHFGLVCLGDFPLFDTVIDTLLISRLLNYSRKGGHSLESWGEYFKIPKSTFSDFSKWSQELEDRCILDTLITLKLYKLFENHINAPRWGAAFRHEHLTTLMCGTICTNGFTLDVSKAIVLYNTLLFKLIKLKDSFRVLFPTRSRPIREIRPSLNKNGSLKAKDFRWLQGEVKDLTPYSEGSAFSLFQFEEFNPQSAIQRVERLNEAGWKPVNKTKGHIEAARKKDVSKLSHYRLYGWTTDEENLATLPASAPEGAKKLANYLLLSSRLSTLKQWILLADPEITLQDESTFKVESVLQDEEKASGGVSSLPRRYIRVHGTFTNPGAWSMRVSHSAPNMANVPATLDRRGNVAYLGREFRELWTVPEGYKLVGVDADSIQLRIFAHLCEDMRLIAAIEKGRKEDKTDIHHLNKAVLGTICNTREVAKTYIYALLLGAGKDKQASILGCTKHEADLGLKRMLDYYPGWRKLVNGRLKQEGERGYITCLDGRYLPLPEPRLALAAHLQSGEKIIMSHGMVNWVEELREYEDFYKLVNWVHDEWQTEVKDCFISNGKTYPELVGETQIKGIVNAGKQLKMNIKLAGNMKIGSNWAETH